MRSGAPSAVEWKDGSCCLLDQRKLPHEETYVWCSGYLDVIASIRDMVVRGAPAIGIAAAYGVVLAFRDAARKVGELRAPYFEKALVDIAKARPTAVNLHWAVNRMSRVWVSSGMDFSEPMLTRLLSEARAIHEQDIANNRKMAALGAGLMGDRTGVMTYCNAGALATGGIGTAVGAILEAHRLGKVEHVFVCETRPWLQGMRLTAWEMHQAGVPFTLICDNMAALVMAQGKVGAVFVGADRIAANGDVANKIGTFALAIIARHHGIPFYVVAPSSTFDLSLEAGAGIPIEERSGAEVTAVLGGNMPSFPIPVFSPAFDVTHHSLISAIVCDKGIARPVCADTLKRVFGGDGVDIG